MTFDTILAQTGTKDSERWEAVFLRVAERMSDTREQAVLYVRETVEAMEAFGMVPAWKRDATRE